MVTIFSLWLPILLAGVLVFVVSSIIHMATPWHRKDYQELPHEDAIREAFQNANIPPGEYVVPYCKSMKEMGREEMMQKYKDGPVGFMTIFPNGPMNMGKFLTLWFLFTIFVGIMTAYLTSRTLAAGTEYLEVFRVAGTVAFLGYAGAQPVSSIWKGTSWITSLKHMIDGLIYALITAGCFGWLWPGS